ncbi:hypothetical protein AWENTII_001033 [Aspergillus wentii]
MRPPRLILLVFCFIFCPIFFTFFNVLSSSPRVATPNALAGRQSGLHALFSFNIPTSLFPPSAIISLTDDNSTFFLARPAAFGPAIPSKGLSSQLWIGSGFGDGGPAAGVEGELGCSDIPGWGEGDTPHHKQDKSTSNLDKLAGKTASGAGNDPSQNKRRADSQQDFDLPTAASDEVSPPSTNDGTDDHLHHPLPESHGMDNTAFEKRGDYSQNRPEHADIQSLQESAEIAGKVVLLSRGGCGFLEKVKWVQRRGGVALIVGDDTRGGSLVTMYARGDTSNVTIPSLFTSYTTAHLLSSLIPPQAGEELSLDDSLKASRTRLASQSATKDRVETSTMTPIVPTPTSARQSSVSVPQSNSGSKAGVFHALMSLLGLTSSDGSTWHPSDSRRPPSSGNINWVLMDTWDEEETSSFDDLGAGRPKSGSSTQGTKKSGSRAGAVDGDGFVIGVHDWRDPDLVAPKSSALPSSSAFPAQEDVKSQDNDKGSNYASASLKGGSITPGSGEYKNVEKSSINRDSSVRSSNFGKRAVDARVGSSSTSEKGWFSRSRLQSRSQERKIDGVPPTLDRQRIETSEHEGLWVTLTPTSMSTSPFFDTLLVLVVSPLLTLTVVYALLLLRSRIRRRRWRAPKSLVERLPVRTYQTMARSSSSSATSSPRASSPDTTSPTSPLLVPEDHSEGPVSRPRSHRPTGNIPDPKQASKKAESSKGEKSGSGSTLWRRKYTGRQVECVVCLEEYVDGESRVMSLPCGHEFHAECITPWLTTRRRTCPICKGDVVRSMSKSTSPGAENDVHEESHQGASSAPVPIALSEDEMSDMEHRAGSDPGLLEGQASSAPPSTWRNLASSFNFSVLSGDTIWHQARADRSR